MVLVHVYVIRYLDPSDVYNSGMDLTFFSGSDDYECAELRFETDAGRTIRYRKDSNFNTYIRNIMDDGFVASYYRC